MSEAFQLPPQIKNEDGKKRRVGFEIEFAGLDLEKANAILQEMFGGKLEKESAYSFKLHTDLGDFSIEADSNFLLKNRPEEILKSFGLDPASNVFAQNMEQAISSIAEKLVPFEIATPPLPIDDLSAIERIRERLLKHSAKGIDACLFTPLGMQFNPELPKIAADTLLSFLKAFFLLFDWLYEETDVPLTRRLAPFINNFPKEYIVLVLNPDYSPSLKKFMTDYLEYNPTRNRPLDLLPLFAHIDKELVFSYPVEKDLVKPRPTFHYRLPNSRVDDPAWTIASDWNKWVEVERVADDPARIARMTADYFRTREETPVFTRSKWIEKTRDWLSAQ